MKSIGVTLLLCSACGGAARPASAVRIDAPAPSKEAPTASSARPDAECAVPPSLKDGILSEEESSAYLQFIDAVREHYAGGDTKALESCCARGANNPLTAEYCSAATSLVRYPNDDAAFLSTLPTSRERNGASNQLDLLLADYQPQGPEPFGTYFKRAWALARAGNVAAVEGFVTMFEQSNGIFAEAAESSLCPIFVERPDVFASLEPRHVAAVKDLGRHCKVSTPARK